MPPDLLNTVMEIGLVEGAMPSFGAQKADVVRIKLFTDGVRGELRIGSLFASEIILEKTTA